MLKILLNKFSAALISIFLMMMGYFFYCFNSALVLNENNTAFEVVRGDSISSVAKRLQEQGVLQHPSLFIVATYVSGQATKIKAGEYLLNDGITSKQLLEKLVQGDVVKRQITFVEGWTFEQMQQEIKKHPTIKATIDASNTKTLAAQIGLPNHHLEGQFFPDSYQYEKDSTDVVIFRKAHELMASTLAIEWEKRSANLPYKTPYEALIMASIVEKETGAPVERSRIAAVFINRLKIGMPLQTDPTVIYGLGKAYKGNLTKAHLLADTPYNTYTRVGLPPTPIANPSREAIHAALHPANEKTLYFVGKGDGTHYFSQTLSEHNKAVRQYQLDRKSNNYHSSPSRQ